MRLEAGGRLRLEAGRGSGGRPGDPVGAAVAQAPARSPAPPIALPDRATRSRSVGAIAPGAAPGSGGAVAPSVAPGAVAGPREASRTRGPQEVLQEVVTLLQEYIGMQQSAGKDAEKEKAKSDAEKEKAKKHVEFCCSLYKYQLDQGRHFVHEHPWSARWWGLPCAEALLKHPSVELAQGHMCRFLMTSHGEHRGGEVGLVKKPTGFMCSSG